MPSVYIVGRGESYANMFRQRGWEVVEYAEHADLIQFTGGEDVDPTLYGEYPHPTTFSNPYRDTQERSLFNSFLREKPMAGICRGGQFLNVMSGGTLYQHVDNHAIRGTHLCLSKMLGHHVPVTSTHHQMMRVGEGADVEAHAWKISKTKENMLDPNTVTRVLDDPHDIEVVYYKRTNSLCFQPHPEHYGADECRDYYFQCLAHYLEIG